MSIEKEIEQGSNAYSLDSLLSSQYGIIQSNFNRRHPDLNWGIKDLQSSALPLGYTAILKNGINIGFLYINKNLKKILLIGFEVNKKNLKRGINPLFKSRVFELWLLEPTQHDQHLPKQSWRFEIVNAGILISGNTALYFVYVLDVVLILSGCVRQ